jgi:arylsulfatase
MRWLSLIVTVSFCAAYCLGNFSTVNAADLANKRPNIILILTDDQGYADVSIHGNPVLKTPHIDRLAKEGVRFDDFRVSPTCSPTRCSLMTGRHEFRSGITHTIHERERMSLKATTFVQLLKQSGYRTGIFGKWHLGDEAAYRPDKRGFDEFFIHGAGGIGQTYPGSCGDAPKNSYFSPVILHNNKFETTDGYCTDVFFGQALKWIDEVKGKQPFYCHISPNAPHGPLHVPEEYEAQYKGKTPNAEAAKFFGMIANIDDNVGRLLDKLRAWDIERDTLVIYMNDNGGTAGKIVYNAGMKGSKGGADNGSTRAMSFWRWPGTLEPKTVDALTAHVDVFSTLTELAGATVPADVAKRVEGFSLLPLLNDAAAPWHDDRMLVTHQGRWQPGEPPQKEGVSSVRWKQYLLVRGKGGGLFDVKKDPQQERDLSQEQADVVARLTTYYDRWWEETMPLLENEDAFRTAPKINAFHELYWQQYQGAGPNNAPPNDAPSGKGSGNSGGKKKG